MTFITKITMQGFKSFNKKISVPFIKGLNIICGPNGVGKSVRGDTEVLLSNGDIKPIGEIVEERFKNSKNIQKLDDGILTFENPENLKVFGLNPLTMKIEEKGISAFIKRVGEKELYKIKTWSGREVVTTGCHPVMIFRDNVIISERMENLKQNDLIAVPKKIEFDNKKINSYNEENELELSTEINENFGRFIGYLIGYDYITKNMCALTNENSEIIHDFLNLNRSIHLRPRVRQRGKIQIVSIYSTVFLDILHKLFNLEKIRSGTKEIPKGLLFAKESVICNLLGALFDCDGHIRKDAAGFEYTTKSEKLAHQIQFLLLRLGIISSIKEKWKRATNSKQKKEKYYYLYVKGIENLKTFYEKIPLISEDKIERIKLHLSKNIKSQRNLEDILPKDVNKVIKQIVKLLGLEVRNLRKQHPSLASYVENRCYPTKDGLKKILSLFLHRLNDLIFYEKKMKRNEIYLTKILRELKIWREEAAKFVGVSSSLFYNWINSKSRPRESHLNKLFSFVKIRLKERIDEANNLIEILENLVSSDIFWDKITKIEKVPGEKWVYDLSIPHCHNFIANGIFVHNSNIVDAICFVLGRTYAKSMRADRLHELIFHGGDGRKPADIASVTLYLDNFKKNFSFEESEVSVTRKVNRKGVSIYKIQGKTVTREKALQLLSSARIHPDGHNIVLQGDITQIIEMNPVERRSVIDEISGIADYNDKKIKAQRDLDVVEQKLKEAEILITERYSIFKRLEEDRNTAIKYQNLQKQLQILKASLANKKLKTYEESVKKTDEDIANKEEESEKLRIEIDEIEREIDEKERNIRQIADKLVSMSKRVEEEKEISELRAKLMIAKDRIDSKKSEIERLSSLIERLQAIESKMVGEIPRAVKEILRQELKGVHGTVVSLIKVPEKYQVAVEVAAGHHLHDIVVEDDEIAAYCIDYLKREKIGRATFIPLNKIKPILFKDNELLGKHGVVGVVSKLIKFDVKYLSAMEFVFGNTLIVENVDIARTLGVGRARMVTLDGDLIERSGAMVGGYYIKSHPKFVEMKTKDEIEEYMRKKRLLESDVEDLIKDVAKLESKLKEYSKFETTREFVDLGKLRIDSEARIDQLRERRRKNYERRLSFQQELNKLKIQRAKMDAELENARIEVEQYGQIEYLDEKIPVLEQHIKRTFNELMTIGPVNFKAIEEYEKFKTEFDEYRKRYEKILEEKKAVLEMIEQIEQKRREVFHKCLQEVSSHFNSIFVKMSGGTASLELENPMDLESGLIIQANPAGKRLLSIDSMSGGEKTITALAFLFAVQEYKPAPFYILDEVDAALDKENTKKIAELIKSMSKEEQFVVITHNDNTIKHGDVVYGVTMSQGESKILGLELPAK